MKQKMRYILLGIGLIIFNASAFCQTTKWRDIYTVKKKDTIFGIAIKYGLSLPELMEANPEMKKEGYMLQKGATIFIPFEKNNTATGGTAQAGRTHAAQKQVAPQKKANTVNVGVMLPLHDVDGDGKRMVEFYRGILMACEKLKQQGISTNIHAWNVPIDADIRTTLVQEGANQCDLIFGPLYTKQVAPLADFCKTYGIKMVIPFSINGDQVDRCKEIFQVYQSPESLNDASIKAFLNRFKNVHPIFVDCNDTTSRKGNFTFGLRKELEKRKITYSVTNVNSSLEYFAKAFVPSKQNVVILNTGRSPQLTQVLNKLDEFTAKYLPSTFYYNANSAKTIDLESKYNIWFHQPMQVAMPRFAITGYDQAMFFIQGVNKYGKDFTGQMTQVNYTPVQTPLHFVKTSKGGYRNQILQLIHYTFNRQIEAVTY